MSMRARSGSRSAISRLRQERQRRADHHADHDAEQRQRRELQEIGRRRPAVRARRGTSAWRWCAAGAARKLEMALPTPTPPTSSADRPTRLRNCVSRLSQNCMPPPASASPRTRQPASGNCGLDARRSSSTSETPGGRRRRYSQVSRLPCCTSPNSAIAAQRDHQARAEACEGVHAAVGLAGDDARASRRSHRRPSARRPAPCSCAAAPLPRPPRPTRRRAWRAHRRASRRPAARRVP